MNPAHAAYFRAVSAVAENKVREHSADYFDFILMDIQTHVIYGYEATKTIHNLPQDLKTPIITLSANAFKEDRGKSVEAGMNDHVAKPINITEMKAVMAKHLCPV